MTMMLKRWGSWLAATSMSLAVLGVAPGATAAEAEAGNNLSYPVLWAEGPSSTRPVVPGVMGTEVFGDVVAGTVSPDDETSCDAALQKSADNSWQADNAEAPGTPVTHVDWGDNLEAKDWSVGSKVRVETVLFDNTLESPMTGYEMCYVSGAMSQDELWGAKVTSGGGAGPLARAASYDAVLTEDNSAIIYSDGGRLTIQRITDADAVSWSTTEHRWVGSGATDPVFNSAAHERTSDGPGSYGAELNIKGRIVYGSLWDTSGLYNGEYRLTFSLDGAMEGFDGSGTDLNSAQILVPVEEELEAVISAAAGGMPGGGGGMPGGGGGGMPGGGGGMPGGGGGGGGGGGEDSGNTAVVAGGVTYIDVALSGGQDAPVVPPDPGTDPTTPPSTGGTSPSTEPIAEPVQAAESEGPGPQAGQPEGVSVPQAATALIRQRARLGIPRSGKRFTVGQRVVLTPKPIKTTAGVTVRWKAAEGSADNCKVTKRKGKVTMTMLKPSKCTIVAWAPAASPEHLQYRRTYTYRVGW